MRTTIGLLIGALILAAMPAGAYWIRDCRYFSNWTSQTSLVLDINPGPAGAVNLLFGYAPRHAMMAGYNGSLYFQADNGQAGAELWRVQGDSPEMVADFAPGSAGSSPHAFAVLQNKLYFAATTPATGEELFRYDGTSIAMAAEMTAGAEGGEIAGLTVYSGAIYFTRSTSAGKKVWKFDGTTAQPVGVINAIAGSVDDGDLVANAFVVFKGRLYFVKEAGLPNHYQLWAYDGSAATKIKTLTQPDDTTTYQFDLGVHEGALYFGVVAGTSLSNHDELWKYTGLGLPVKIATLGDAYSFSQPADFQSYKGKLYFGSGIGLSRVEGSTVENLGQGPGGPPFSAEQMSLFSSANRLFLTGYYEDWIGREPYTFDGTLATPLANIMPDSATPYPGSFPTYAVEVGDALYFYAEDQAHGRELWRVTGKTGPMMMKCDIVVAPIWDDWRLWIVKEREVVVTTWLVGPDARTQLLSREVMTVVRGKESRVRVLELDTRSQSLPEGFALATLVFDRKTGAVVDRGFGFVGTPSPRLKAELKRTAAGIVSKRTLKGVMTETVKKY